MEYLNLNRKHFLSMKNLLSKNTNIYITEITNFIIYYSDLKITIFKIIHSLTYAINITFGF